MHRYKRSERVSELIRREISIIIDQKLRDGRIGMVTVTGVDMSNDLKNAKVFVSIFGSEEEERSSLLALNSASEFIRARVGEKVTLRYLPKLSFYIDSSTVEGMRMDKLLDEIKNKEN